MESHPTEFCLKVVGCVICALLHFFYSIVSAETLHSLPFFCQTAYGQ